MSRSGESPIQHAGHLAASGPGNGAFRGTGLYFDSPCVEFV